MTNNGLPSAFAGRVAHDTITGKPVNAPDHPEFSVGRPARPTRRRFNLIAGSCLTVIILSIVWMLITPFVVEGHSSAILYSAMSNAKQLALGALMYADDADDHLPRANLWMDSLKPYVPKPTLVYPSDFEIRAGPAKVEPEKPRPTEKVSGVFRSTGLKNRDVFGFAFRRQLSGRALPSIADRSRVALIFDSTNTGWNANGGLELLPNPGRYEKRGSSRVNIVAFADGYAKALTPGSLNIK